jgi:tetratricopeptide (TPR) repeat protein
MDSNDSGEIDRLYRFSTRPGPRFGLAIAIFADRVLAAQAREQLRQQLSAAGLRVATLELHYDDERHDIVQRMIDASADADGLFVVGLDRLVTDVFGRTRHTTAIANLNQRRDDLPQVLDVRVVFWVAKTAYTSLSDVAWDLCQVMLTTAELEATREVVIDTIRVETPPEWLSLARADEAPHLQRQLQNFVRLYETATTPRAAGDAAASAAELEIRLGHMASARTWYERAIAAHERAGQFEEAGRLSRRRAEMALFVGELDDAQEHAEGARGLARRAGQELDAALAQALMAEIVGRRGDVEAAIASLETEVMPILVKIGDAAAQAEVLSKIANFREVRGELDEALELRKQQIAPLQQQVAVTRGGGGARANVDRMVALHARKGELDEAARLTLAAPGASGGASFATIAEARGDFEAASEIREREGGGPGLDPVARARALEGQAAQLRSEGELEQALQVRREQELPIYEELGDTRAQTVVLGEIADLLAALGRTDEASKVLEEQMLPRADRLGDARLQARASSKALQLRRARSPTRSAKQAESSPAPAAVAAPTMAPAPPKLSPPPTSTPALSLPPPEPIAEAGPHEDDSWSVGAVQEEKVTAPVDVLEAESKPSDAPTIQPKPSPSDGVGGPPTAEPTVEKPMQSSRLLLLVVLVVGIVLGFIIASILDV